MSEKMMQLLYEFRRFNGVEKTMIDRESNIHHRSINILQAEKKSHMAIEFDP
jgi:hypothetical protein